MLPRLLKTAILLALLLVVLPAQAASREGLVFRINCDGFVSRGGDIVLNRDNTGVGREQFVMTATDGNGNVVYAPTTESFRVGARITFTPGLFFGWTSAPTANPITVRIYSPAGNNLNEQTIYAVNGSCASLETVQLEFDFLDVLDGRTSPSVPLNAVPPRPNNPGGVNQGRVGYLIVNTDNLNIRSGDGPEYTVVGIVDGGTELVVLGRNENRSWWYVQVEDVVGWVSAELTLIRGDLTTVPVVPVVGEIARPSLFLYTSQFLLTVPVEGALTVCEIPGNTAYYIIGQTANGTWFELEASCGGAAVTGWVLAEQGGLRNPAESFIPVTD
jgi:hypothetical protein